MKTVEARVEAWAERQMDKLDAELLSNRISLRVYEKEVKELDAECRRRVTEMNKALTGTHWG